MKMRKVRYYRNFIEMAKDKTKNKYKTNDSFLTITYKSIKFYISSFSQSLFLLKYG